MNLKPSAPKHVTVMVSIALVLFGLFGALLIPAIANNGDWFLLIAFVILLAGVYFPDL